MESIIRLSMKYTCIYTYLELQILTIFYMYSQT